MASSKFTTFIDHHFRIDRVRELLIKPNPMKAFFACLLCFVFASSQSYAISGGPFQGPGRITVTGTYSGVMTPSKSFSPGKNSIALFTMEIPSTGLASGTVVIFDAGLTFSGPIQAIADPDTDIMTGEIDAQSTVSIVGSGTGTGGGQNSSVIETAVGSMRATIKLGKTLFTIRMKGVRNENHKDAGADIQFSKSANAPFDEIIYDINGFKQSS
jgi:hypothetical protein